MLKQILMDNLFLMLTSFCVVIQSNTRLFGVAVFKNARYH